MSAISACSQRASCLPVGHAVLAISWVRPQPSPSAVVTEKTCQPRGFFAALFDSGFSSFVPHDRQVRLRAGHDRHRPVRPRRRVAGFASHTPAAGLVVLFLAPIVGLIYLAFIRMGLELCYALVRMSDDIHFRR
jgi:hypothetical protein